MINQIVEALKISLKQCNKIDSPVAYAQEVLNTISRYKTNIFKIQSKDPNIFQDPKELFQIRIGTSWRTKPDMMRRACITDRSPVLLYVNGYIPDASGPINKERNFNVSVDISDIIDIDKLNQIKTDWYRLAEPIGRAKLDEDDDSDDSTALDMQGIYFVTDRTINEIIDFNIQFNANISHSVLRDYHEKVAAKMANDPKLSNEILVRRAEQAVRAVEMAKQESLHGSAPLTTKAAKMFSAAKFK